MAAHIQREKKIPRMGLAEKNMAAPADGEIN
jgi:hypothetical protein